MDNIRQLLTCKRDYLKRLVSDGKILMNHTDINDMTLLTWASLSGDYDILQLCVNLGSQVDHKDRFGDTALDIARNQSWYHCEQLLLFSKLNANVSDHVQNIAFNMNKQNGIIENIICEINNIIKDENKKNKFINTLTKILSNMIGKKLSFSDDLLNLCWVYNKRNNNNNDNDTNDLWQTLMKTCNDIIENGNKKDWYYFKTFILPSKVSFFTECIIPYFFLRGCASYTLNCCYFTDTKTTDLV